MICRWLRRRGKRLRAIGSRKVSDRSTFQRGTGPAQVAHREIAALLELAQGRSDRALELLDEGIEIAESMGPPRGSASPVKPIHELYGEVLLELETPAEAVEMFEASLLRTPNRPRSLLGLARALDRLGDRERALESYAKVAEVWHGRDQIQGYVEAQEYLKAKPTS